MGHRPPTTVRNDLALLSPARTRDRRLQGDEEARLLDACGQASTPWLKPLVQLALETGLHYLRQMDMGMLGENAMSQVDRLVRTVILSLSSYEASNAVEGLRLPQGILGLRPDAGNRVSVTYDLRHVTLATVESWLAANGLRLSDAIFARLYRRWLAFKDDNRRDQAAIVHQCCSVPPSQKQP